MYKDGIKRPMIAGIIVEDFSILYYAINAVTEWVTFHCCTENVQSNFIGTTEEKRNEQAYGKLLLLLLSYREYNIN